MGAIDLHLEEVMRAERTAGQRVAAIGRFPRRAVRRAIEYIHANLAGNVGLADIAAAAGLSAFHFSRVFKMATGMAPHRYLLRARVEKVKALLRETEQCLAAIADEAGFSDQSHMSNVFKRFTGTTPGAFRNAWPT